MSNTPLLQIEGLRVGFRNSAGSEPHDVVHGVHLSVGRGEAVGLVGESGSGKSVVALSVLSLLGPRGMVTGGRVMFDGTDLTQLNETEIRRMRGKDISMVFQDPTTALNPAFAIGTQLIDVIRAHRDLTRNQVRMEALEVLDRVGFADPLRVMRAYPHELSGGMRQRAMIAMAIACKPRLVLADEPTTALDVTVQAQIVELLRKLVKELDLGLIFITHNLDLMGELCDRAVVMYQGHVMESARTADLFDRPSHPYTKLLFESIVRIGQPGRPRPAPARSWQGATKRGSGCAFAPRCHQAIDACGTSAPPLRWHDGSETACWRAGESAL